MPLRRPLSKSVPTSVPRRVAGVVLAAALALGMAACSGSDNDRTVTMLTHDSFELPSSVIDAFHQTTGMTLKIAKSGDAGKLASQISLTPGSPKGDLVYGIDNTFASRPIEAGALESYVSPAAVNGADEYALPGGSNLLTAVNRGDASDVRESADGGARGGGRAQRARTPTGPAAPFRGRIFRCGAVVYLLCLR